MYKCYIWVISVAFFTYVYTFKINYGKYFKCIRRIYGSADLLVIEKFLKSATCMTCNFKKCLLGSELFFHWYNTYMYCLYNNATNLIYVSLWTLSLLIIECVLFSPSSSVLHLCSNFYLWKLSIYEFVRIVPNL